MVVDSPQDLWLGLKVVCDAEAVEDVTELFTRYGFNRHIIEEVTPSTNDDHTFAIAPGKLVSVRTYISSGDLPPDELEDTRHVLWVVRQALWVMGRTRAVGPLEIVERQDEDWDNEWKEHFSLHRVGNRVLVKAPWCDYEAQPGETVIELDPGTAFGTGKHASTRLCMQALEEELKAGDSVLDVGIGSGALATAAALLGASAVDGVDIDPPAIRAAKANAERNGVGDKLRVALGSIGPDSPFPGPYDLVLANIIAQVLIELAPDLANAARPGGTLILGGILDDKEDSVREAFADQNLTFVRRSEIDDWRALVYRKPD